MHVMVLSDHESFGGAAIAARRLTAGLRGAGHRVTRIVNAPDPERDDAGEVVQLRPGLRARSLAAPWPDIARDAARVRSATRGLRRLVEGADALLIHNLHGARGDGFAPAIARGAEGRPVVWTLHDTWAFTGRCAYPGACRRFERVCTPACPTAEQYPSMPRARVPMEWLQRRRTYARVPRLVFVAPSTWMARTAASSALLRHERIETIPNGLDPGEFPILTRKEARRRLGLPLGGRLVLLAAHHLDDPRKGGATLDAALGHLRTGATVVALGTGGDSVTAVRQGIRLGPSTGPAMTAAAYAAADVSVVPSLEENAPLVIQESLMSGTPVVGSRAGGIPELLIGAGGFLAEDGSPVALARALDVALSTPEDRQEIRRDAERRWHIDRIVTQYVELIAELLEGSAR